MKTIFALASGRSGTSYLANFFKYNVSNCFSTHEPYFVLGNPVLFGAAVAWNTYQEDEKLLQLLQQKKRFISSVKKSVYFESNHAFLKTCDRYAAMLVDEPGFVHLVRNPLYVAKSELIREQLIRRLHIPLAYYKRNGEKFFRWSLTGHEAIYEYYLDMKLSRYQFYLLQWIELEYRAVQLLKANKWQRKVFFIEVEKHLNDSSTMQKMLDFFKLETTNKMLKMDLRTNKTPFVGQTIINEIDLEESRQVMKRLPYQYQSILMQPPYQNCDWVNMLL